MNSLKYLSALSVYLPLLSMVLNFKHIYKVYPVLFAYIVVSAITDTIGIYTLINQTENNNILYNVYCIVEPCLLGLFYLLKISNRNVTLSVIASILGFNYLGSIIYLKNPDLYSVFLWSGSCVLIVMYAIIYLYDETMKVRMNPFMVWYSYAAIAYYFPSSLVYSIGNYLTSTYEHLAWTWCVPLVFNIFYHLAIAYLSYKEAPVPELERGLVSQSNSR